MPGEALPPAPSSSPSLVVGRYALYEPLAAGGMATVHVGRLFGEAGFSRTVAVKRLHPHLALMPEFAASFVDEARIAARIRHPNVVPVLDVVAQEGELFLVMDYVEGATLSQLGRQARAAGERLPPPIAAAIVAGALHGLHAAHEAHGDGGAPLGIVHRDVSPQNVLVGADGVPRVLDFGIAKAMGQLHLTEQGRVKGKLAYMAPEQALGGAVSRQTDVFAASVVLWEALTGARLFEADSEAALLHKLQSADVAPPSALAPDVPAALDEVVLRGLARDPRSRWATAEEMAVALERAVPLASAHAIGQRVRQLGGQRMQARAQRVAEIESVSSSLRLVTGSGAVERSAVRTSPSEAKRSELWKLAAFALALAVLVPAVAWLATRGRETDASRANGAASATATATATATAAATATAVATASATAAPTATAPATGAAPTTTAVATATARPASAGRPATKPGASGGKLYSRD